MLPSVIDREIAVLPGTVDHRYIERHPTVDGKPHPLRVKDVTASKVWAVFGYHPYCTIARLWAEKRGVIFPEKDAKNKIFQRGRWCEPAVAAAVRELHPEWTIEPAECYLRDPILRLGATPDFFIHGDPRGLGVLQAKTAAPPVFYNDWDRGREVPMWITAQTTTEMMLADAAFGAVAVLLVDPYDMDCKIQEIPRHALAEAKICDGVKNFWFDIAAGNEPPPDFSRDAETIRALAPKSEQGRPVDLSGNNELPFLLAQREDNLSRIHDLEARNKAIETEIKFLMREAEVATGLTGWRITYKTTGRAGYQVDPKPDYRPLRIYDRRTPEQKQAAAISGLG